MKSAFRFFYVVINYDFIFEQEDRIYKGVDEPLLKFGIEEIANAEIFCPYDYVLFIELRPGGKFGASKFGFGGFFF